MLSGFRKKTQDTQDNNNNSHQKPLTAWARAGSAMLIPSVYFAFSSPRGRAGLRPSRPPIQCPCASVALGCHRSASPPPHPDTQTGWLGHAAPAGRPGPAVLRGNLARGTQLEGNFGILQETIVGEEGVGCCVQFLYFPSERSVLGRQTPF